MVEKVKEYKLGEPKDKETTMGPVVSQRSAGVIRKQLADARESRSTPCRTISLRLGIQRRQEPSCVFRNRSSPPPKKAHVSLHRRAGLFSGGCAKF